MRRGFSPLSPRTWAFASLFCRSALKIRLNRVKLLSWLLPEGAADTKLRCQNPPCRRRHRRHRRRRHQLPPIAQRADTQLLACVVVFSSSKLPIVSPSAQKSIDPAGRRPLGMRPFQLLRDHGHQRGLNYMVVKTSAEGCSTGTRVAGDAFQSGPIT